MLVTDASKKYRQCSISISKVSLIHIGISENYYKYCILCDSYSYSTLHRH